MKNEERKKTVREAVIESFAQQFSIEDRNTITDKTTLEDQGADSLDVVELLMDIEEELQIVLPEVDSSVLLKMNIGELTEHVEKNQKPNGWN